MNDTLKLPVGIDDFKKIREAGFYYVDKTKLIEQLLQGWAPGRTQCSTQLCTFSYVISPVHNFLSFYPAITFQF